MSKFSPYVTESSSTTCGRRFATAKSIICSAEQHEHLTGLVQETQQYREMLEEPRTAQSVA